VQEWYLVRIGAIWVRNTISPGRIDRSIDLDVDESRKGDTPECHEEDDQAGIVVLACSIGGE